MDDIYLFDLIGGAANALDHVSTAIVGHHRRVGVASVLVGKEMGLPVEDCTDLLLASLLHDIGAFSLELRVDGPGGLDFDVDISAHADVGYRLLRGHPMMNRAAGLVRDHHTPWQELNSDGSEVDHILSNTINLMDRVDLLCNRGKNNFGANAIRDIVGSYSEAMYAAPVVQAFMRISEEAEFWELMGCEDCMYDRIKSHIRDRRIPQDQLPDFARFFSSIIDFRSRHTATHSQGVAETAVQLARLVGMGESDQKRIRLAGNLHDIGKLAVPVTLLDKPASLSREEFHTVKNHAVVCQEILTAIPGLEDIAAWAWQHHERLNGTGYPDGLTADELSQGSRIMAVADVFTAITEDRPYRAGMPVEKAHQTMVSMVDSGALDPDIVNLLIENFDQIDAVRRMVQSRSFSEFQRFRQG